MDGQQFGPYTASQVKELDLLDDILVTEESLNGEWLPASHFDFDDMIRKESGMSVSQPQIGGYIDDRSQYCQEQSIPQPLLQQSAGVTYGSYFHEEIGQFIPANYDIELKKWNWGAFTLNWLWGVCNGVYWTLAIILVNLIPYIGLFATLVICIILGINGNQMAWKAKQGTMSIESFLATQRKWNTVGLWIFWIMVALIILGVIVVVSSI